MDEVPLTRPREGRLLGGVCAALAKRFELDVTLIRIAWVVGLCCFGVGGLLYVILWVVIPGEK